MSLHALMALLGHVTPQMTLHYAALASPTLRIRVRSRFPTEQAAMKCLH